MKRMFAAVAVLAAAACTQTPQTYRDLDRLGQDYEHETLTGQPAPAAPLNAEQATAQDTCGAARFRSLIGTQADQIDRASLPARTRVIMPGQMVTMDFSPDRLNIRVAPGGVVTTLECF